MQHPFSGIIVPPETSEISKTSGRRHLLKGMLVSMPILTFWTGLSQRLFGANPTDRVEADELQRLAGPHLYLVVPRDARKFDDRQRRQLGVLGPFVRDLQGELKDQTGWLAWLDAQQAAQLDEAEAIESVTPISAEDKPAPTGLPNRRAKTLIVMLAPNTWQQKPPQETYADSKAVAESLQKLLAEQKVEVKASSEMILTVRVPNPGVVDAVVSELRKQPQVMNIEWAGVATTLALGEEGGGRVTTQALGEEGNPPRPSTRRLGEEGGPPPTTLAVGEEGGPQPTTLALGEEGGLLPKVTTFAVGEEG